MRKPGIAGAWQVLDLAQRWAIVLACIAMLIATVGLWCKADTGTCRWMLVDEFYANLSSEMLGIALTVWVIDLATRREARVQRLRDLVLQASSPSNDFALEAVRLLRALGELERGALREADLTGANLRGADLSGADLRWTTLTSANLNDSNLKAANLQECFMFEATLVGATLTSANLHRARLQHCDLSNAKLSGADFSRADLRGSKLCGATLWATNLTHAGFKDTDLSGVVAVGGPQSLGLTDAQRVGIIGLPTSGNAVKMTE